MNVEADFMTEQLLKHRDGEISRKLPLFLLALISETNEAWNSEQHALWFLPRLISTNVVNELVNAIASKSSVTVDHVAVRVFSSVEVLGVMAKYNPFFEKVGMVRVDYQRDGTVGRFLPDLEYMAFLFLILSIANLAETPWEQAGLSLFHQY